MIEHFLMLGSDTVEDDSELPFPAGTPFKGIVKANTFITGDTLAQQIGLSAGMSFNSNAGWLHFIEDNGLELYIAKKPLRYKLHWSDINAAQSGKELTINGDVYIVRFLTGTISDPAPITDSQAGGEWNRYMYNVFKGEGWDSIPGKLDWGPYTNSMLGIQRASEGAFVLGSGQWVQEAAQGQANGYVTRGRSGGSGVPITSVWYGRPSDVDAAQGVVYGWRPVLVKKSSIPPSPFLGEVPGADFITATALVTRLQSESGMTIAGTAKNNDTAWLKYLYKGKTLYMTKKPIRHSVVAGNLRDLGIFTGTRTLVINGQTFKVRVPSGTVNEDNEWNNLIYRVYGGTEDVPNKGEWARYSNIDLDQNPGTTLGNMCLCQGYYSTPSNQNILTRGGYPTGIAGQWYQTSNGATNTGYAWRPILELVE